MYYWYPMFNSDLAINFIKNIIFNNNIKEDSILKGIIESVQKKKKEDSLFNL